MVDAARSVGLRDDERETMVLVIRQAPDKLVIDRIVSGKTRTITYALTPSTAARSRTTSEARR